MNLSVVIPAYNEEDNIVKCIADIYRYFKDVEVVVVNDSSTDSTLEKLIVCREHFKNLVIVTNKSNLGHGATIRKALGLATRDYILYIDADRQIDLTYFRFPEKWEDIIGGYRVDRHDKPFRLLITRVLRMTNLLRHFCYIKDANCPFKIYRRSVIQSLLPKLPETNIIPIACLEVLARRHGFAAREIPTYHKAYDGVRQGFLQSINRKSLKFCFQAFMEVIKL